MSNNINDLSIKNDIFPFFNYTLNDITKFKLLNAFNYPLKNKEEIYLTQNILKGFIQNLNNIKEYNYSKIYFHQVYDFLNQSSYEELDVTKLELILSSKTKNNLQAILIQIVSIFDRILNLFLKKLNQNLFPDSFNRDINTMIDFIASFNIEHYKSTRLNSITDILNFSKKIIEHKNDFNSFYALIIQSEIYLSFAKGIVVHQFTFPEITEHEIEFKNLFHPLLKNPVANDIKIQQNVILLTGPNMSGKSTFLKSVFLSVYLGHLGLAVPAKSAKFPFFDYFSISINQNDDLKSGYSHFMNEIISLKNTLINHNEGKRCFVIFD
jgi:DNA mismatch repair protein MutS